MPNWEMDVHLKEMSRDVETCTCVKKHCCIEEERMLKDRRRVCIHR